MLLLVIYLCNIGNTRKLVFFVSPTFYSISSFPKVKDEGGFALSATPHFLSAPLLPPHWKVVNVCILSCSQSQEFCALPVLT